MSRPLRLGQTERILRAIRRFLVAGLLAAPAGAQQIGVKPGTGGRVFVTAGSKVTIPVNVDLTAAAGANIASLQSAMNFDAARLTFDSIRVVPAGWTLSSVTTNAGSGTLTFNTSSATSLAASGAVANAYFRASTSRGGTRVSLVPSAATNQAGASVLNILQVAPLDVCVRGKWGDANADTVVNIIDAQQIARYTVALSVANAGAVQAQGDVNADNAVNIIDAQQVARFTVGLSAAARINTLIDPAAATVTLTPGTTQSLLTGATLQLAAVARDAGAADLTGCVDVTYASSSTSTATVSSAGLVTGVAVGAATITATSGTATAQITVNVTAPPTVTTTAPSSIGSTGFTANGAVNPMGIATSAWIEYGTSPSLATSTSTTPASVGSGSVAVGVAVPITGLTAATTYYYRVAATNSAGTARGTIQSAATTAAGGCGTSGARAMTIPQTVSDSLVAADCKLGDGTSIDYYSFTVASRKWVQAVMTSSGVNAFLTLYDANGNEIVSDDDGAGGTNARITRLLDPGTYYIGANSLVVASGTYTLDLSTPPLCTTTGAATITVGQTVSGALAVTDCIGDASLVTSNDGTYEDFYKLTLAAGQSVQISMNSTAFDSYLWLLDSNGALITSNDDDVPGGQNSRITRTLTAGTYYIVANSFFQSVGAYQLSVITAPAIAAPNP